MHSKLGVSVFVDAPTIERLRLTWIAIDRYGISSEMMINKILAVGQAKKNGLTSQAPNQKGFII